ncbi:MAG TPA: nitroreductase [Nitrospirae bacterium]|nr:nitroreductase [Nitrospirota bacterium]
MRNSRYKKLNKMFIDRWSPRAFKHSSIALNDIETLFEAARWSPSCLNEQPWRFIYADKKDRLEQFQSILVEANKVWAKHAPLLVVVFAKKNYKNNGKPNRWSEFDTGAACMALALQANHMGLSCHIMGGFDERKAYEVTAVPPDDYKALCVMAIGEKGDPDSLPAQLKEREAPSQRIPLTEIANEG